MKSKSDSKEGHGYEHDLLGLIMEATLSENGNATRMKLDAEEIIHEFGLREEVLICGSEVPDADKLSKLKLMTMVLHEALRLYEPVINFVRDSVDGVKVGNLMIPKNTTVCIGMAMIHHDKKYWGEDAKSSILGDLKMESQKLQTIQMQCLISQ
ncbi:hypothetical protein Sjap_023587 [Stephania japonica]|uniref:Cytochrome P450 n=1 Tax=Stephania japonica TaxID=461633 RepID=A0AAP0EE00_9MAGN